MVFKNPFSNSPPHKEFDSSKKDVKKEGERENNPDYFK